MADCLFGGNINKGNNYTIQCDKRMSTEINRYYNQMIKIPF